MNISTKLVKMNKTKIEKKLRKKISPELVKTILIGKKKKEWVQVAHIISGPTRKRISLNLSEIDSKSENGDVIVVPGKILSLGEIRKKIKIVAFSFSEQALKKLKERGIETSTILEEIEKNPEAKKVKILGAIKNG